MKTLSSIHRANQRVAGLQVWTRFGGRRVVAAPFFPVVCFPRCGCDAPFGGHETLLQMQKFVLGGVGFLGLV